MSKKSWVQKANLKSGKLHAVLGIPPDKTISVSKLRAVIDRLHKIAKKRKLTAKELHLLKMCLFAITSRNFKH